MGNERQGNSILNRIPFHAASCKKRMHLCVAERRSHPLMVEVGIVLRDHCSGGSSSTALLERYLARERLME